MPSMPVSVFVQQLAESDAVPLWLEQAGSAIMEPDLAAFERLCQRLDDYPPSARRLFVPSIRRSDLLHQAVVNDQPAMVRRLIPWSNLSLKDMEGQTALMRAVGVGSLDMVQALEPESRAADRDAEGRTALMHALLNVRRGTPVDPIVDALWSPQRLHDQDKERNTLLHLSVDTGGAYVPALLQHLDANRPNRHGVVPLMRAAMSNDLPAHPTALHALCAATDPHLTDQNGATPFLFAVGHDAEPLIDALWATSHRRDVQEDGRNALHLAVRNGVNSQALVRRLLDDGVDPHHLAGTGKTPFQSSTLDGPQAVFQTFLDHVPMGTDASPTDLLDFVLNRVLKPGWDPHHPFVWDRFAQVVERYDRAALVQRLDDRVAAAGPSVLEAIQERLPTAFALYEGAVLKGTLGRSRAGHAVTAGRPRARL